LKLLKLKPKHFYQFLNSKLKSRNTLPVMKNGKGDLFSTDYEKFYEFLKEFKQVFTTDDNRLLPFPNVHDNIFDDSSIICTAASVTSYLKKVNNASAPGPDGKPGKFWSSLSTSLGLPLSLIFNTSFQSGCVPSMWKVSYISPIHKKGDPSCFSNYRPVALTCIPCRVMEAMIRDVMSSYLNEHNLISVKQHGFRKGHSTGLQILECVNDWTMAIESGKCIDVCYIDFSRAFDTVSIPKLLHKFAAYGFRGLLLNWLKDFLSDRTLRVKINNSLSGVALQTSGIAQGTSLGPLCFTLFINDLPSVMTHCTCELFADDAKIYHSFSPDQLATQLQTDLQAVVLWADTWQLSVSTSKTFLLHLGPKNPHIQYKIKDVNIQAKGLVKDLGVVMSDDLSWHAHCVETVKKANCVANAILHSFACNDISVYMGAFNTYVRPILEYNCFVWNPVLCCDIDIVENVQKCFTRRAFHKCGLQHVSYSERLRFLEIDSLEYRRMILSLTTFYNIYYNHVSCNILRDYVQPVLQLRGHSKRLFVPFCKTSIRKNFFSLRMLNVWNCLPNVVVCSNVVTAFKYRLRDVDLNSDLRWF
jgi:ribonuclease P/MRP protein subunit RPP40